MTKIGDVVEAMPQEINWHKEKVLPVGLKEKHKYVVIGYARQGGVWLQDVETQEMPVNPEIKKNRISTANPRGYYPKELKIVSSLFQAVG